MVNNTVPDRYFAQVYLYSLGHRLASVLISKSTSNPIFDIEFDFRMPKCKTYPDQTLTQLKCEK